MLETVECKSTPNLKILGFVFYLEPGIFLLTPILSQHRIFCKASIANDQAYAGLLNCQTSPLYENLKSLLEKKWPNRKSSITQWAVVKSVHLGGVGPVFMIHKRVDRKLKKSLETRQSSYCSVVERMPRVPEITDSNLTGCLAFLNSLSLISVAYNKWPEEEHHNSYVH